MARDPLCDAHLASSSAFPTRMPVDRIQIQDNDIRKLRRRPSKFLVEKGISNKGPGEWFTDFVKTVPPLNDPEEADWRANVNLGNPQTDLLLEFLELDHAFMTPFSSN